MRIKPEIAAERGRGHLPSLSSACVTLARRRSALLILGNHFFGSTAAAALCGFTFWVTVQTLRGRKGEEGGVKPTEAAPSLVRSKSGAYDFKSVGIPQQKE